MSREGEILATVNLSINNARTESIRWESRHWQVSDRMPRVSRKRAALLHANALSNSSFIPRTGERSLTNG